MRVQILKRMFGDARHQNFYEHKLIYNLYFTPLRGP
jgi:hypothetical protein